MIEWLMGTFWGRIIATVGVSMIPVLELRMGIPFGVALGLNHWVAFCASVVGNMIPVPFILFFIEWIFKWLKRFDRTRGTIEKLEKHANNKGDMVRKYSAIGLFLLVAVPLPGTGAWTGALVAALLQLPPKKSMPIIFLGVLVAGMLILGITYGFTVVF